MELHAAYVNDGDSRVEADDGWWSFWIHFIGLLSGVCACTHTQTVMDGGTPIRANKMQIDMHVQTHTHTLQYTHTYTQGVNTYLEVSDTACNILWHSGSMCTCFNELSCALSVAVGWWWSNLTDSEDQSTLSASETRRERERGGGTQTASGHHYLFSAWLCPCECDSVKNSVCLFTVCMLVCVRVPVCVCACQCLLVHVCACQ